MGDLKMAAARNDASLDSDPRSRRSTVNIQFVDEDELPLAHLTGALKKVLSGIR